MLTARAGGTRFEQMPIDDRYLLAAYEDEDARTLSWWQDRIDRAIASGSTLIVLTHRITSPGDGQPAGFPKDVFEGVCDYLYQKRVWVPAIDEWWNTMAEEGRDTAAYGGRYVYVTCGSSGMVTVDVSQPTAPIVVGTVATRAPSAGLAVHDEVACVCVGEAGLEVVNTGVPSSPRSVNCLDTRGTAEGAAVCGSRAYIADGPGGLSVADLADPSDVRLMEEIDTSGAAEDVVVVGSHACIAEGTAGVETLDVSEPSHARLVSTRPLPGEAESLTVVGDFLYVADGDAGLRVVPLD
jgi:hypothetical protein